MITHRSTTMENQRLDLSSKTEAYYLGPELTLRGCELAIAVPARALTIVRTRLEKCSISAKKKLTSFRWSGAMLMNCRFTGTYSGNQFGNRPDDPAEFGGGISGGDFTAAVLDGCDFYGCDMSAIKLPRWPCLTVLNPVRRIDELRKVPWPGGAESPVEALSEHLPEMVAATFVGPTIARDMKADPEDLRAVLSKLPDVIL